MLVNIRTEKIAGIPCLHVDNPAPQPVARPLALIYHGFMSVKERYLQLAYYLAKKGIRVIMPDVPRHGDRQAITLSRPEMENHYYEIIRQAVREAAAIKTSLTTAGLIQPDKIGVAGVSMGGFITFGLLAQYPWVVTAVSLMGQPDWAGSINYYAGTRWTDPAEVQAKIDAVTPENPIDLAGRFTGKPLLFWHGEEDTMVPIDGVKALYAKLQPFYRDHPENLQLVTVPGLGHYVTNNAIQRTAAWLLQHLGVKPPVIS
ncbi:MAG: alpha/beta fold hydrolase [Heliobacteriaceae bacterium]|nr:alpha/beta fold hydrolase [Heliobacteriaceae bacterium]